MKKNYVSPDLELVTFRLNDVILASILIEDETITSSGVVVIGDEEIEEEEP